MTYLNPQSEALFKDAKPHWTKAMTIETDLIERLEKSDGPDRELDAEIAVALCIPPPSAPPWFSERFSTWEAQKNGRVVALHTNGDEGPWGYSQEYTASIDAALTLMPKCFDVAIVPSAESHQPKYYVRMASVAPAPYRQAFVRHDNRAIALCIAALKARSQS